MTSTLKGHPASPPTAQIGPYPLLNVEVDGDGVRDARLRCRDCRAGLAHGCSGIMVASSAAASAGRHPQRHNREHSHETKHDTKRSLAATGGQHQSHQTGE